MNTTIFFIENTLSGRRYVGQTRKNLKPFIKKSKIEMLRSYNNTENELYKQMKMCGIANFKISEIEKHFYRDIRFIKKRMEEIVFEMRESGYMVEYL